MNNSDFIAQSAMRVAGDEQTEKRYGNLIYRNGVLYSYGSHYHLLFKLGYMMVVNSYGYSNTTARHISLARRHADLCVELPNSGRGRWYSSVEPTRCSVMDGIEQEIERAQRKLDECVRPVSQKREWAERDLESAKSKIAVVISHAKQAWVWKANDDLRRKAESMIRKYTNENSFILLATA